MGHGKGQTTGLTIAQQCIPWTPTSLHDPNPVLKPVGDTAFPGDI